MGQEKKDGAVIFRKATWRKVLFLGLFAICCLVVIGLMKWMPYKLVYVPKKTYATKKVWVKAERTPYGLTAAIFRKGMGMDVPLTVKNDGEDLVLTVDGFAFELWYISSLGGNVSTLEDLNVYQKGCDAWTITVMQSVEKTLRRYFPNTRYIHWVPKEKPFRLKYPVREDGIFFTKEGKALYAPDLPCPFLEPYNAPNPKEQNAEYRKIKLY